MPRVLVVDDDPMVCSAIEVCLTRRGFEVTVADGGEAGMRALESSDFDVMLIDVFMPHMRGFESTRMFHERKPFTPDALLTSVNQCLTKPTACAPLEMK